MSTIAGAATTGSAGVTTMTTESPRPRARPRPGVELRRWIIAALALAHVAVWRVVVRPAGDADAAADAARPVDAPGTPTGIWLDDLPVSERPSVAVPVGWQLVDRHAVQPTLAPARPRLVRAPAARPRRVRTRTS
ncbi:MAG: hypothetical protein R3B06_12045 [Kofleriaceae bacterium]